MDIPRGRKISTSDVYVSESERVDWEGFRRWKRNKLVEGK